MTELEAVRRQARARHRGQPRHRRRDRRGAGRRRRACHPDRAQRVGARAGRGADPRMPAAPRPSRRWTSTIARISTSWPRRSPSAGAASTSSCSTPRCSARLSPVEHLDAKELERVFKLNVFANQALIAAFDPLLRRAEKAEVVGITSSVGEEPRAFWGGYGASKAAFDTLLGAYADETAHAGSCASRSSIRARPAPECASSPSPARNPKASSRRKSSPPRSSNGCRAMRNRQPLRVDA